MPGERKTRLGMADKTLAFVQKLATYAANNPAFVPSFLNLAELQQDAAGMAARTDTMSVERRTPTVRAVQRWHYRRGFMPPLYGFPLQRAAWL